MSKKELLAEYNTLRNEIINRIQNQHDIFKYTFVAILSLLSINYLSKNEYIFIFIFVILIISKISYQYNKIQSIKLSTYIKFFIETKSQYLKWETRSHYDICKDGMIIKLKNMYSTFLSIFFLILYINNFMYESYNYTFLKQNIIYICELGFDFIFTKTNVIFIICIYIKMV